jgi:hypothetical protein
MTIAHQPNQPLGNVGVGRKATRLGEDHAAIRPKSERNRQQLEDVH